MTESNKAKETETRTNGSATKPVRNEGTVAKRTNGAVATGSSVVKGEGAFQLRCTGVKLIFRTMQDARRCIMFVPTIACRTTIALEPPLLPPPLSLPMDTPTVPAVQQ